MRIYQSFYSMTSMTHKGTFFKYLFIHCVHVKHAICISHYALEVHATKLCIYVLFQLCETATSNYNAHHPRNRCISGSEYPQHALLCSFFAVDVRLLFSFYESTSCFCIYIFKFFRQHTLLTLSTLLKLKVFQNRWQNNVTPDYYTAGNFVSVFRKFYPGG